MEKQDNDLEGAIGSVPVCYNCGSELVVRDAWACWNPEYGLWELENVYDDQYCRNCESETRFRWKRLDAAEPRKAIRELNDRLRREGRGHGGIVVTAGIMALGPETLQRVYDAVQSFDAFTDDNDPWGEHDFGSVEVDGEKIFWKIDAFDPSLTQGSENPANEAITQRVLTIMLAGEY